MHCQGALVSTAHHSGCAGQVGQAFFHPPPTDPPPTPIQWLCWPGWSGFFFLFSPPPPPHITVVVLARLVRLFSAPLTPPLQPPYNGCAGQVGQAFFCPADPPSPTPPLHTVVVLARLVRLFFSLLPPPPLAPSRPPAPKPSQWLCWPGWSGFFLSCLPPPPPAPPPSFYHHSGCASQVGQAFFCPAPLLKVKVFNKLCALVWNQQSRELLHARKRSCGHNKVLSWPR